MGEGGSGVGYGLMKIPKAVKRRWIRQIEYRLKVNLEEAVLGTAPVPEHFDADVSVYGARLKKAFQDQIVALARNLREQL